MSRISVLSALGVIGTIVFQVPGAVPAISGEFIVRAEPKTDFKAVFGRVESRDLVQARARIGGTIVTLDVEEGSSTQAGAVIARVVDDKLALHMGALDARLKELDADSDEPRDDPIRSLTWDYPIEDGRGEPSADAVLQ